jgi:uncharacterized membrane protein (UPF0127 family)
MYKDMRSVFIIGIIVTIGGLFLFWGTSQDFFVSLNKTDSKKDVSSTCGDTQKELSVKGEVFCVYVANTEGTRTRGLSVFDELKSDEGMLFVFEKSGGYGFWMKDMKFAIDIVWIDSKKRVVHIENNVLPESYPQVFYPQSESLYVLEFISGTVGRINLQKGDIVKF